MVPVIDLYNASDNTLKAICVTMSAASAIVFSCEVFSPPLNLSECFEYTVTGNLNNMYAYTHRERETSWAICTYLEVGCLC